MHDSTNTVLSPGSKLHPPVTWMTVARTPRRCLYLILFRGATSGNLRSWYVSVGQRDTEIKESFRRVLCLSFEMVGRNERRQPSTEDLS